MSVRMHRRRFLQASTALAAHSLTGAIPAEAASVTDGVAPLDRVRVAIVGVAGQGGVAAHGRVIHQGDNRVPDLLQVDYEYPARAAQPAVHLTWYHGVTGPDLNGKVRYAGYSSGVLFEGERGNLIADYGKHRLLPEERFQGFQPPRQSIPNSVGHHREWLDAIRGIGHTTCNFAYSGALAESVLLGNVAYRAGGGKLQYDAKRGRVSGNKKAEQYLRREYRRGWTL